MQKKTLKMLKTIMLSIEIDKKRCMFSENSYANMQKTQTCKKTKHDVLHEKIYINMASFVFLTCFVFFVKNKW